MASSPPEDTVTTCHVSPGMLYLHQEFDDFDQVMKTLQAFQERTNTILVKVKSKSVECANKRERLGGGRLYNTKFVYSSIQYACKHYGFHRRPKEPTQPMRRQKKSQKTGCPMNLWLSVHRAKDKMRITVLELEHNHPTTREAYNRYTQVRRVEEKDRETIEKLLRQKVPAGTIARQIRGTAGKQITAKDIQNMRTKMNNQGTENERIQAELARFIDTNSSHRIHLGMTEEDEISMIYIQDAKMQSSLSAFSGTLLLDMTQGTNKRGMILVSLLMLDAYSRGQVVALALLDANTRATCIQKFLEIFQGENSAVVDATLVFVMRPGLEERDLVEQMWPGVRVIWLVQHVLDGLDSKVKSLTDVSADDKEEMISFFKEMAYASSEAECDSAYEDLGEVAPREFIAYFQEHWFGCKQLWVRYAQPPHCDQKGARNAFRSWRRRITRDLSEKLSLSKCLHNLLDWSDAMQDYIDMVKKLINNIATPDGAVSIDEELSKARSMEADVTEMEDSKYQVSSEEGDHIVILTNPYATCTCPCFTERNLLCRHIFWTDMHAKLHVFNDCWIPVEWRNQAPTVVKTTGEKNQEALEIPHSEEASCLEPVITNIETVPSDEYGAFGTDTLQDDVECETTSMSREEMICKMHKLCTDIAGMSLQLDDEAFHTRYDFITALHGALEEGKLVSINVEDAEPSCSSPSFYSASDSVDSTDNATSNDGHTVIENGDMPMLMPDIDQIIRTQAHPILRMPSISRAGHPSASQAQTQRGPVMHGRPERARHGTPVTSPAHSSATVGTPSTGSQYVYYVIQQPDVPRSPVGTTRKVIPAQMSTPTQWVVHSGSSVKSTPLKRKQRNVTASTAAGPSPPAGSTGNTPNITCSPVKRRRLSPWPRSRQAVEKAPKLAKDSSLPVDSNEHGEVRVFLFPQAAVVPKQEADV